MKMSDTQILVIEDELAIRDMIGLTLERAGFDWSSATTCQEAQQLIAKQAPNLILLDWMLPGISGMDYLRQLKRNENTRDLPVIMLTARGEEGDRVKGLESGADDYLSKPFSTKELIARIKAVLRRSQPESNTVFRADGLELDASSHRVTVTGHTVSLGPTEFKLLHFLIEHPERVYSRDQLLDGVWGNNVYIEDRTVDVHIRRLRKALAIHNYDRMIQTVRGSGYRFSTKE